MLIASVLLMPLILKRGELHVVRHHWREFFWVGIFTAAIPFTLMSYVSLSMTAGYTSLLNATVPMFSAIIAWFWLKQTLTWVGIRGVFNSHRTDYVLSLA
jgi:drug/metabolite transporter (DMT)-like permease